MSRVCGLCRVDLDDSNFTKNRLCVDGIDRLCRSCKSEVNRGVTVRFKDRYGVGRYEYNIAKGNYNYVFSRSKSSDRSRGLYTKESDYYSNEELKAIYESECTYCGRPYTGERLTLDRIDNSKGHQRWNVVPACRTCNIVRNNHFSVDEMKLIGAVIAEIFKKRENG